MQTAVPPTDSLVLASVHNGIATLTLNRPKALNALNLEMVQALYTALTAWANDSAVMAVILRSSSPKALCAGGDIRYFHATAKAGQLAELDDFFAQEYALNHLMAHYPKPYIAIMQGVVMGGGMGISATARLRIVTTDSKLAMPETKIGLFPDVGGTHFLSRLDGELGVYVGLTGTVLDAASARFAGLADAYCPDEAIDTVLTALHRQRFTDGQAVLHHLRTACAAHAGAASPRNSALAAHKPWIDAHFTGDDWLAIAAKLHATATAHGQNPDLNSDHSKAAAWARACLAGLEHCSPLMLHVTLKAIRAAHSLDLAQALAAERSLMRRCFAQGEPIEGIRALAVDKDHAPRWTHAHWNNVPPADVAALFAPT